MKTQSIEHVVQSTIRQLPHDRIQELREDVRTRRPPQLVPKERMVLRQTRLAEAVAQPSRVDFERLLGTNDLVDVNYLIRALHAARSICRVVLRDQAGREIGYGTGFKVAPSLLLTNHHVLETPNVAGAALAEFDYELDVFGKPRLTTRFCLEPAALYLSDRVLDFALVAISTEPAYGTRQLDEFAFLRLVPDVGKINRGEYMTIIQHPSGQPKQIALRENELLSIEELVLWYQSDTAQGSSGSPVFNDSWQVVALHHSGVPRTDGQGRWLLKSGEPAGPEDEDGDIDWIANEGIRASRIVRFVEQNAPQSPLIDEFLEVAHREMESSTGLYDPATVFQRPHVVGPGTRIDPMPGGARVTVPLSFTVSFGGRQPASPSLQKMGKRSDRPTATVAAVERLRHPIVDSDYGNRRGYDPDFLGLEVPLPTVRHKARVAKTDEGNHELPYEHFSVVVDKDRRLALFTASNVDAREDVKKPEPGRDYSRDGLGGFEPNDREMWLTDPRIPEQHQLPDRFYTKDGGAFDKGHLVRRDDVCWGDSYEQVQRANGDTYHTTNCSPQVADFNRSSRGGIWGKLENLILKQAETERYCVLSGPLLQDADRLFIGKDHRGEVRIQIPSAYWKIVVVRSGQELQAFGFLLEQDLTDVPLEFAVDAEWTDSMVSIEDLEAWIGNVRFPAVVKKADQYETQTGEVLFNHEELQGIRRGRRSRVTT